MSFFDAELRIYFHERLEAYRGRRVSSNTLEKAFRRHFGSLDEPAFLRLFEGCSDPWTVTVSWPGPEAEDIKGLSWYTSAAAALSSIVGVVDEHRLYPSDINVLENGGLALQKDGKEILRCERLEYFEPPTELAKQAETIFKGLWGPTRNEMLLLAGKLPNLSKLRLPFYTVEEERTWRGDVIPEHVEFSPSLGNEGLLTLSPDALAEQYQAMAQSMRIAIPIEAARAEIADVLGFHSWTHLCTAWSAAKGFMPYLFEDFRTGARFWCRTPADALVALEQAAGAAKRPSATAWAIFQKHSETTNLCFALGQKSLCSGPYDTISNEERKKCSVWIESVSQSYERRFNVTPFIGLDIEQSAQTLREMLGVGQAVARKVAQTDDRRRTQARDVGVVHVSLGTDSSGEPEVLAETLRPEDGWRYLSREKRVLGEFMPSPLQLSLGSDTELHLGKRAQLATRFSRKDDFHPRIDLSSATREELEQLAWFLRMKKTSNDDIYQGTGKSLIERMMERVPSPAEAAYYWPKSFKQRRLEQDAAQPKQDLTLH